LAADLEQHLELEQQYARLAEHRTRLEGERDMLRDTASTAAASINALETEVVGLKQHCSEVQDGKANVEQYCVTVGSNNEQLTLQLASMTAKADDLKEELEDAQGRQQDMIQFDSRRCDYIDLQLQAAGMQPAADPMG
jgi:chromosome segregation ATPase